MKPNSIKRLALAILLTWLPINALWAQQQRTGGSDGGGGSGYAGQMFERYIVDPTALPSFKTLKPIFDNLDRQDKAVTQDEQWWTNLLKVKTWYLAPVTLKQIGKKTLGVDHIVEEPDQIGRQPSLYAPIWLDSRKYKAHPESQSIDIMHEYIEALYMLQFWPASKMGEVTRARGFEVDEPVPTAEDNKEIDRDMPARPLRPLNQDDYNHIQDMTDWLMKNGATASLKQVDNVFLAHNFDPRLFKPFDDGPGVDLTAQTVSHFLRQSQIRGFPEFNCVSYELDKRDKCTLFFEFPTKEETAGETGMSAVSVRVTLKMGSETVWDRRLFIFGEGTQTAPLEYGLLRFSAVPVITNGHSGERFEHFQMAFKAISVEEKEYVLTGFVRAPRVITRARTSEYGGRVCDALAPHATDLMSDAIYGFSQAADEHSLRLFASGYRSMLEEQSCN
jgi:hypothetical protein